MAWPRNNGSEDLAKSLTGLPEPITVIQMGSAFLVLGPCGAQVLAVDNGDPEIPRSLGRLASVIRSALAEQVSWVPFVHPMLVTDETEPCPPATPIPSDLLVRTLVGGPTTVGPNDLRRLQRSITAGALDGLSAIAPTDRVN